MRNAFTMQVRHSTRQLLGDGTSLFFFDVTTTYNVFKQFPTSLQFLHQVTIIGGLVRTHQVDHVGVGDCGQYSNLSLQVFQLTSGQLSGAHHFHCDLLPCCSFKAEVHRGHGSSSQDGRQCVQLANAVVVQRFKNGGASGCFVVVVGTARKLKTSRRWHIHAKRLASSAVTGRLFAKDDLKILKNTPIQVHTGIALTPLDLLGMS